MKTNQNTIRLGTRGSALALKQADMVSNELRAAHPGIDIKIVTITTTGDKILDKNLAAIGGKGLFIKEIEEELLANRIDIAVHSMKDMPAIMPDSFSIPCVLVREDANDIFVSEKYQSIEELPHGAVVGTSSSRRAAQALNIRPDLKVIPFRGNVNTRLKKISDGEADATFLALAGIHRLGLMDSKTMHILPCDKILPAVSQGAIGIEILENNTQMHELLKPLNHLPTFQRIKAERSFMRVFEGSCTTPIAALAEIIGNEIRFNCLIAKPDGTIIHRASRKGKIDDGEEIGKDAALELKKLAGENFFV